MTVGSWTRGNGGLCTQASPHGVHHTRVWSGGDSWSSELRAPPRDANGNRLTPVFREEKLSFEKIADEKSPARWSSIIDLVPNALRVREDYAFGPPKYELRLPSYTDGRKAKRERRLADNAYDVLETETKDIWASFWQNATPNLNPGSAWGGWGGVMAFTSPAEWGAANLLTANDQIKLVQALEEKVKKSDFNMAVFIGEGRMALKMITESASRISRALTELRKGNVRSAVHELVRSKEWTWKRIDSLPNVKPLHRRVMSEVYTRYWAWLRANPRWLEPQGPKRALKPRKGAWQEFKKTLDLAIDEQGAASRLFSSWWLQISYGWIPLLKDMEEGAKQLAHLANAPMDMKVRVSRTVRQNVSRTTLWSYGGTGNRNLVCKGQRFHRRSIVAEFTEALSLPKLLGLTSLESVAWESTLWSFVIDWVIPIGDWLQARAFAQGLNAKFVTSDLRVGVVHPPTGTFTNWYLYDLNAHKNGVNPAMDYGYRQVHFVRAISTTLDVPKPNVKPLMSFATWKRAADAVSLLVQALPGRLRGHLGS